MENSTWLAQSSRDDRCFDKPNSFLEITEEDVSDDDMFLLLLNQAEVMCGEGNITKSLADGAYDRKELFNELEKRGIPSGIKMRKDAATKSRGSPYRSECVRRRNKVGYDKWAEETGYGMRWKVEGLYSGVKRIFGETVRAIAKEGMIQEAWRKFYEYHLMMCMQ